MLRLKFEARVQAAVFAELLGGARTAQRTPQRYNSAKWGQRVPASDFLGQLGVKF